MAEYVVSATSSDSDLGLTFEDAVAKAGLSPEADTIRFSPDLLSRKGVATVELTTTVDILSDGGRLIIDGDVDGDGLADIVLKGGDGPHLEIQSGANVTIRGMDFIGGYQLGEFGEAGARGSSGGGGTRGLNAWEFDTASSNGEDGSDATSDGTDGEDGGTGETAVGAILNRGDLTLERVGFGENVAQGGEGGSGGNGGAGVGGGSGGEGSPTSVFGHPAPAGGTGGDGGDGTDAGDGGRGGDGGHAAGAVLNADGGTLTLTDVTFGGRLSSGLSTRGNTAWAGGGGEGGDGGWGGAGGPGGDGGLGGAEAVDTEFIAGPRSVLPKIFYWDVFYDVYRAGPGGIGGLGGDAGDGGNGGYNGDGGSASTLLNLGGVSGTAAFVTRDGGDGDLLSNTAEAGEGDRIPGGPGGAGGWAGAGGPAGQVYPESFKLMHNVGWEFDRLRVDPDEPLPDDIYIPLETEDLPYEDRYDFLEDHGILYERPSRHPVSDDLGSDDGTEGSAGRDGGFGANGEESEGLLNLGGAGEVEDSGSIVFVHDLGQTGDTLAFNVIRLGNTTESLTLSWVLEANGPDGVSGADFVGVGLPAGKVRLKGFEATKSDLKAASYDRSDNVERVEIEIAGDTLKEGDEGYRIRLIDPGLDTVVLGTSEVHGTIDDRGIEPSGPPEISGKKGSDILKGTNAAELMLGKAGKDVLKGRGGDDTLDGGSGNDKLVAGGGNDALDGGGGNDTLIGGGGSDTLNGGTGNDLLKGGGGPDTIEFEKGGGKDVVAGFSDDTDTLALDKGLWDGHLKKAQVISRFAENTDEGVLLDFGRHEILIKGFADAADLVDDLAFI